ncbi:hypothetical protein DICPUDRAFT_160136, partial [Dictyostelium purpureum]
VFGAISRVASDKFINFIELVNPILENIQFEPLLKPSKKTHFDLLLYDLPTKLKECVNQYSDWEIKRSMFTDEEKNNYFMKLAKKHLNNLIQLKSIKDYKFICIVMVDQGHSKIEYSPSDGLYYLNKLSINSNDNNNNDNLTNYSKITIGSIKYNILEILNLNHHKDNDIYFDYKTMILLLETTDTNEKIYCIRKQKKEHLTEDIIDEVKFEEIDNNKFKEFNDQIIVPCYIVQDINTSYYFFKSELKIKSIEDIIEKDYNDISIIRSLLYYFEYFVSNPSNSNQVILIKSKSVLDQQTEDFLIILDISYFIRRVYGFYIEKIKKIKENVHLVKINDKFYIRKITGSIRETKEIYEISGNFEVKYCENTTNLSEFEIKYPSQIIQILKQMVNILEKLEEHDVYHRDIKNENILIQENNGEIQCILSDFGTSGIGSELKKDEEKYYSRNGSRNYQPHEIYIKKLRSKNPIESLENKHDIFSLGCVIQSLFDENKLIAGEEINTIIKKMTQLQLYICKRIKLFNLETLNDSEIGLEKNFTQSVNQELKFLKRYSNKEKYPHLNIIQYIEDFITIKPNKDYYHLNIITEFYENGDLSKLKRTLNGPNKITGEPEYEFYLGDLGSSRIILGLTQDGRYTQEGTNQFIAPEVIGGFYTPNVDVYSLGVTLLKLYENTSSEMCNLVFLEILKRMANEDEHQRPQPSQILEFICKHYEFLRLTSGDLIHRNLKESLYFVNQKYNFFEKSTSTSPIDFNLNNFFNFSNHSLNFYYNSNNNNGFDITKDYKCIGCVNIINSQQYFIIIDGKYFSLFSVKSFLSDKNSVMKQYFDLMFSEEMFSFYFMECSKVFPLGLESNNVEPVDINEADYRRSYYLIVNPTENTLKQISLQNPNAITKKIQLILLFKLILLFFQIFEKGDIKMLYLYFHFLNGFQVFLTNKNEPSKDEENQEPFNDVRFSILSTFADPTEKLPNFIDMVFKVYNIETKDPVIDKIYDYFSTTFEKAETPVYFQYKYIYQILENEKERLINENKYLMEYYDKLDTSYNNILKKTSISETFVINPVKQFHKKSKTHLPIYIVYLEGEVFGAISRVASDRFINFIELVNPILENIQFEPLLKPSKKTHFDLLLYDLPTKLKECVNQYSDWEIKRSMFTDEEKNNYFMKLAKKHLNNLIQLKSIKDYKFIYGLETIIIGEEIFYFFDYLGGSPFSIVGSIYDIALYFFGQEDSCQQLLNLNFFKYLNILFCYSVMVAKGHSKIEYSPSDGLYYLNKLSTNNNDNNNNDNLINYSKITIGSIKYNILEILNLNHQKDNDLYYDYKTMILLLETTDTNEKIYCIRKQKKEHLTEKTIDEVKFEEIDNNKFKEFNDQIIVPCYIVQDINTSYYFFKSELKIKSIEDIIEKDYNDISIIRSLLYYFEYFVSNPSNSNQVILIKSKSVLDQQTEDFLIILDISYFIRRVYGFYIEKIKKIKENVHLVKINDKIKIENLLTFHYKLSFIFEKLQVQLEKPKKCI